MNAVTHPALRTDTEGNDFGCSTCTPIPMTSQARALRRPPSTWPKVWTSSWRRVRAASGSILNPAMDRPDILANIADIRRQEMDRAREILGIRQVWLGFVDSGLPEGDPLPPLPNGCFATSTSRWPRLRWSS